MPNKFIKLIENIDVDKYRSIPFWSWNDDLKIDRLVKQVNWMKEQGFGGYFMHARGGLKTPYLGEEWFECIRACILEGGKLNMQSWAYDENGWPSGFVGGKLLEEPENCDLYLTYSIGEFDDKAYVNYEYDGTKLLRVTENCNKNYLNVFVNRSLSTVDILNYEVVEKFINLTHQKYKEVLGEDFKGLSGFFTDEPQYFRQKHPYTKVLEQYFKDTYDEDILDRLGLVFVEADGYRDFRYKYWKAMQTLMLENFAKQVYDWCHENNIQLTGHYIEESLLELQMTCCAGIMPFYEYEDIPGIDKLKRSVDTPIAAKQASSVARQLGKKQVISETFAMCGWDVTPKELKVIAEAQYVNGVNLMCQHLLPYSEHGQRKRDYPSHFSWVNPWVRQDFKTFNDYFARLGALIGESKELVNVGVFCPLRSIYFDYKREKPFKHMYEAIDKYYVELTKTLARNNIPFHIIDETILAKYGKVLNNKLVVGLCEYDYVIFPKILTMDTSSKDILEEFYDNGGKLLFTEGVPTYLEGNQFEYRFHSNTTFDEIIEAQLVKVNRNDTEIQASVFDYQGNKFIYVVNTSMSKDYEIIYHGEFSSFVSLDLEKMTEQVVGTKVHLDIGESKILFLSDNKQPDEKVNEQLLIEGPFEIIDSSDNFLTLDKAYFSYDGVNYSEEYHVMGIFDELMSKRTDDIIYLKYIFEVEEVPEKISFYSEDMNLLEMKINGVVSKFEFETEDEQGLYGLDISKLIKKGKNEVVMKIHFFEKPEIYYALYTDGVTESLRNCISYDTTIEACYLKGDFGVYSHSGFVEGNEKNVLLSDDFYISGKKSVVTDLVSEGYPFFSGNITLKKIIEVDKVDYDINILGRYHLSDIIINKKVVEKSYFSTKFDASKYLVLGKNEIEIRLFSSNRNLLGPHHCMAEEEPLAVRPTTFEALKTWTNGKSTQYRDNYSFVKFGIFNN